MQNLNLTDQDRQLIAYLDDLPLVPRPWQAVAELIGMTEAEVLHKLGAWSAAGFFRYVRALFNNDKLGYQSTLAALAADEGQVDSIGETLSASPFVSHNFLRHGTDFNLWFTLTCPVKGPTLAETIDSLSRQFGRPVRRFDTVRYFKISFGTLFQAGGRSAMVTPPPSREFPNDVLIRTIGLLQNDLTLTERPFASLAQGTDLSEDMIIDASRTLKHRKILRRLGVILDLKNIEENQNVMCVWDPPEDQIEVFGRHAANHPRISHCYQRVHYPDWPWKIYTVFHGRDRQDCLDLIDQVGRDFPQVPRMALWTVKEYKQRPIRYDPAKIVL